jgi:hypothetical protein
MSFGLSVLGGLFLLGGIFSRLKARQSKKTSVQMLFDGK